MTEPEAPDASASDHSTLAARLIAVGMVIGGLLALYYHVRFTATWSPTNDGNAFGTGWILEAVFWVLRGTPTVVWAAILVIFGALALHGMSTSRRDRS